MQTLLHCWRDATRTLVGVGLLGTAPGLLTLSACTASLDGSAEEVVLSTFPAGGSELRYELVVDSTCTDKHCPMFVRLMRSSTELDSKPLAWASPTVELKEDSVGSGWGVGDVLGPPDGMRAWTAEMEDVGFATVARPVKLSVEKVGLLVTQRLGVEPVKRWHQLLLIEADSLVAGWTRQEGDGPTWSTTHIIAMRDGREGVLYAEGYETSGSGNEQPDRLELTGLSWDAQRGKLVEGAAADIAPLVIIRFGTYPTVASANAARASCLFRYWILDAARFEGLPKRGYFVGGITSDSTLAREALAEAGKCATRPQGTILPYMQRE